MNTETPDPIGTTRRISYIAGLIAYGEDKTPGTLATTIDEFEIKQANQRITDVLDTLADILRAGNARAQTAAREYRRLDPYDHAGDFAEGRARAFAEAIVAVEAARAAVTDPASSGRTRQENAQAFAETIITGTTNGIGATP